MSYFIYDRTSGLFTVELPYGSAAIAAYPAWRFDVVISVHGY